MCQSLILQIRSDVDVGWRIVVSPRADWLTVSGVVVIFICINIVVRGNNISALVNCYFWRTKHNKGTDSHPHQPLDVANFWRIFIHKVQDPALYEGFESLMNNTKFKIDIVIFLENFLFLILPWPFSTPSLHYTNYILLQQGTARAALWHVSPCWKYFCKTLHEIQR